MLQTLHIVAGAVRPAWLLKKYLSKWNFSALLVL